MSELVFSQPVTNRLRMSASPKEAAVKEGCPVLSQFPEGFLGKLRIRRSGKMELKLGDIVMDVCEGAASSFLQVLHMSECVYHFTITGRVRC